MSFGQRITSGRTLPVWVGWAVLAVSVAGYVGAGLIGHQPFYEGGRALRYFDLKIYRGAALRTADQTPLYPRAIYDGLGFTYPPFAALAMLPLAYASLPVDAVVVTILGLALLVWTMRRTLLLTGGRPDADEGSSLRPAQAWTLAALAAGAALWLEPVSVTLGYGQINLLVTALVIGDLSRPADARTKGVGIGLAAALKLTPLVFIPYLLFSGRRRAAASTVAAFAASITLAYLVMGRDAAVYWGGGLFSDVSRVGGGADWANQSLHGALARLMAHGTPGPAAELLVGCVAAFGLTIAVRYSRRGDEAAGFCFAAVVSLLASPVSWTHHWTLAVPALVVLAVRAHQRRSRLLWAAVAALLVLGYAYVPELAGAAVRGRGAETLLTTDPYVIAAVFALTVAGARAAATLPVASRRMSRSRPLSIRPSAHSRTT